MSMCHISSLQVHEKEERLFPDLHRVVVFWEPPQPPHQGSVTLDHKLINGKYPTMLLSIIL